MCRARRERERGAESSPAPRGSRGRAPRDLDAAAPLRVRTHRRARPRSEKEHGTRGEVVSRSFLPSSRVAFRTSCVAAATREKSRARGKYIPLSGKTDAPPTYVNRQCRAYHVCRIKFPKTIHPPPPIFFETTPFRRQRAGEKRPLTLGRRPSRAKKKFNRLNEARADKGTARAPIYLLLANKFLIRLEELILAKRERNLHRIVEIIIICSS